MLTSLGLRPGCLVADLGCGRGELSRALAAEGAVVHGFDLDPAQIAAARAAGPGRFEVADVEDLSELRGGYDAAVCRRLLGHVRDPVRALQQMASIAKVVVAIEPTRPAGPAGEVLDVLGEAWLGASLEQLLAAAGLVDVRGFEVPGATPPLPRKETDRDVFLARGGGESVWEAWRTAPDPAVRLRAGIGVTTIARR